MYLETNTIIFNCRIPVVFWEMMTGEKEDWRNPGKVVQSYIIATALYQEMTVIPKDLAERYDSCVELSKDLLKILQILDIKRLGLIGRYRGLGFAVPTLGSQLDSLQASVAAQIQRALEMRSRGELEAYSADPRNRHQLISIAHVYYNLEDQITHQEKRIEKK
jgi:hypothetical protein